ncbi:MAG: hypothetical protein P9L92_11715 [Candidatus Electryonea clarkiae]|nr:hypothetical protein [Candidatus Electryonea clarkiae]MDP8285067.1 hypothetical protein [Candidatus Electryonea clarkiae]
MIARLSIDKDNNRAERNNRPLAATRKISDGNRPDAGATAHSELMSIIELVKKQGIDWFQYEQ